MALTLSLPSWEIATDISTSFNLPSDMRSHTARDHLRGLRFDQAPVMRDGRLIGWVRTSHLVGRGQVEARTILLDLCIVLSRETPVGDTLKAVAQHDLVFLAGPAGISEFVVASDLDRHAVRCYLFVLLSELEMHMADLVEHSTVSDDQVRRHFQARDRKRYDSAAANGMETRAVEYLVFSAYKSLAPMVPGILGCFPGQTEDLTAAFDRLTALRNCVAHPAKSLTAEFDVTELASLTAMTEEFVSSLRVRRHELR